MAKPCDQEPDTYPDQYEWDYAKKRIIRFFGLLVRKKEKGIEHCQQQCRKCNQQKNRVEIIPLDLPVQANVLHTLAKTNLRRFLHLFARLCAKIKEDFTMKTKVP